MKKKQVFIEQKQVAFEFECIRIVAPNTQRTAPSAGFDCSPAVVHATLRAGTQEI